MSKSYEESVKILEEKHPRVQCTVYSVRRTVYSVQRTAYNRPHIRIAYAVVVCTWRYTMRTAHTTTARNTRRYNAHNPGTPSTQYMYTVC